MIMIVSPHHARYANQHTRFTQPKWNSGVRRSLRGVCSGVGRDGAERVDSSGLESPQYAVGARFSSGHFFKHDYCRFHLLFRATSICRSPDSPESRIYCLRIRVHSRCSFPHTRHCGIAEYDDFVASEAAANRRAAGQSGGSDNLTAIVAADRAFPAAVAELVRRLRHIL
jgi:hypothetical protein